MTAHLVRGDARRLPLASGSVQCVVTSPPYMGLRAYQTMPVTWADGWRGELGSEPTPALFVAHLVEVMRECWRVLRDDGVCFVNMGSSYAGSGKGPTGHNGLGDQSKRQGFTGNGGMHRKRLEAGAIGNAWVPAPPGIRQKSDMLIPQRLAIALSDDGWIIRQVLIWAKNNPMPESIKDRWTTAHEYVLMLVKQPRYYFDQAGIAEPTDLEYLLARTGGAESRGRPGHTDNGLSTATGKSNHAGIGPTRNGRSVWNLNGEAGAKGARTTKRVRVSADDASCDTERTTSPDCLVHGDHPAATAQDDGPPGETPSRIHSNGTGHDQVLPTEPDPTPAQSSVEWAQAPFFDPAELPHNTPSSRTAQSESTRPSCSASSETPFRTGDRSASPEHGSLHPGTAASNTSADFSIGDGRSDLSVETGSRTPGKRTLADVGPAFDSDRGNEPSTSSSRTVPARDDPSERTDSDTLRTSSCTCTYHRVIIQETQHFAQFPREIPRRCILAATSEYGACAACGAAWKRVVERTKYEPPVVAAGARNVDESRGDKTRKLSGADYNRSVTVIGQSWQPNCRCGPAAGVRPCIVADVFSGSGTTAFVAASLGRVGVGVELSAEYTAQARYGRLAQEFLPLAPEAPQASAASARPAERPVGMFDGLEVGE